jgi:hypothetical protein
MNGRWQGRDTHINVAKSIGCTLGTIAAKADAAQKALSPGRVAQAIKREGKELLKKSTIAARKTRNVTATNLRGNKLTRDSKRGLRRASYLAKRTTVRDTAKRRASRRTRDRR